LFACRIIFVAAPAMPWRRHAFARLHRLAAVLPLGHEGTTGRSSVCSAATIVASPLQIPDTIKATPWQQIGY